MKPDYIFEFLSIDIFSATPKYLQLANSITRAIQDGKIQKNDTVPSINELSFEFEISRDTAEKAYKYLKNRGILGSVPGKGYFIRNADLDQELKIFLLFNKLSTHKKIIYDSLVAELGERASIDFYIYNNDFSIFKKLLNNRPDDYTHYVIIPHFLEAEENAGEILNTIPKDKLILLDKIVPGVSGSFGAVYENFEKDLYGALEQANEQLSKYETLNLIFPEYTYYPEEILKGFRKFCRQYAFNYKIIHDIEKESILAGNVFINLMDNDLVTLIEKILETDLQVGKDVGVISYNETPLKRIILNGITTISTDFEMMGREAARLIMENSTAHMAIPFSLRMRASL